jgi:hypothetical protein
MTIDRWFDVVPSKAAEAEMDALRHIIARLADRIGIVDAQWTERRFLRFPCHIRLGGRSQV